MGCPWKAYTKVAQKIRKQRKWACYIQRPENMLQFSNFLRNSFESWFGCFLSSCWNLVLCKAWKGFLQLKQSTSWFSMIYPEFFPFFWLETPKCASKSSLIFIFHQGKPFQWHRQLRQGDLPDYVTDGYSAAFLLQDLSSTTKSPLVRAVFRSRRAEWNCQCGKRFKILPFG